MAPPPTRPRASGPPASITGPGRDAPVYFLSDLHLKAPSGPRTDPVLAFLAAREGEAAAVYLVGDIFDFWIGHRSAVYAAYLPFLRQVERLARAGTRVVLFSGNHDPDPGPRLADFGLEVHEGPLTEHIAGRTVRIEHGDTIDPRGWHRRLPCRFVRHPATRAAARLVPPDVLWGLAARYAGRDGGGPAEYGAPLPAGLRTTAFEAHRARGVDVWVLGHYHRAVVPAPPSPAPSPPASHPGAGLQGPAPRAAETGPLGLFVLGDWVAHRTYLRVLNGQFDLFRFRGAAPPTRVPPGDHGPEPG